MSLGCRWVCAWTVNLGRAKRAATEAANANLPNIDDRADDGRSASCCGEEDSEIYVNGIVL